MFSGKPKVESSIIFFTPCQIDVLSKQLVSPLSGNDPLSEAALGESYILMTYRYSNAKENNSFGIREFMCLCKASFTLIMYSIFQLNSERYTQGDIENVLYFLSHKNNALEIL